jgi:hypothetical protein
MNKDLPQKPNIFEKTQIICLSFFHKEKRLERRAKWITGSAISLGLLLWAGLIYFMPDQSLLSNEGNLKAHNSKIPQKPDEEAMKGETLVVYLGRKPEISNFQKLPDTNYEAYNEYVNYDAPFTDSESTSSRIPASRDTDTKND